MVDKKIRSALQALGEERDLENEGQSSNEGVKEPLE